MSFRILDDSNQRRVDVDVGTAADASDALTVLALVYMVDVTASSTINHLWKDCHARSVGRAASALYMKMNGTNPVTLHEMQTASGVLQQDAWQWVAFSYRFSDSDHHAYHALHGDNLREISFSVLDSNTRVGMEDNSTEPMRIGSRQLATYNYDRNWDNDVAILVYYDSILTLAELRLQQQMLYPRVGTPLFMHIYDGTDTASNVSDLSGNGYDGVPNSVQAGTTMPTTIMRAAAGDPMSLITPRSIVVDAADEGYVGTFVGSTNTAREEGLVVLASFAADVVFHLRFDMPPTLPSGTGKLRLRPTAAATSGNLQINPKWLSVAGGESADPAAGSYNAEGTTTITWGAGDSEDQLPETLITLDADTLVANETVYMLLVFESASTLAVDGFIRVDIKFE